MTRSAARYTASGTIVSGRARIAGFYVASTSSGTITLYDGTDTSGRQISGTITPAVGFHHFPVDVAAGLYASIGSTIDVTFFTET